MKVGDYITCDNKEGSCAWGKVIGIVTGFDQDKDPMFTVVYSNTGKGFGVSLNDYKRHYKVIKDKQLPEVIHQWGTTTPLRGLHESR